MPRRRNHHHHHPRSNQRADSASSSHYSSHHHHHHQDFFHNDDHPACRLLHELAQQVFFFQQETKANATSDHHHKQQQSAFAQLLGNHFSHLVRQQQQLAIASQQQQQQRPKSSKKKRRKKKKKKNQENIALSTSSSMDYEDVVMAVPSSSSTDNAMATASASFANDVSTGATAAAAALNSTIPTTAVATVEPVASSLEQEATTTTTNHDDLYASLLSSSSSQQTTHTPPAQLQDFLQKVLLLPSENASTSTTMPVEQLSSFWKRILDALATTDTATASTAATSTTTTTTTTTTAAFRIPHQDVLQVTNAIVCDACRHTLGTVWETSQRVVVLPTRQQQHPSQQSYRQAFDYVAMEEGTGPPLHHQQNDNNNNDTLVFELLTTTDDDNSNSNNRSMACWRLQKANGSSLTFSDLHNLLYDYLLGRGISYEDLIMGMNNNNDSYQTIQSLLTDNVLESIQLSVESKCTKLLQEFTDCAQELERQLNKFRNEEKSTQEEEEESSCNIDMHSFAIVKEVDEGCCYVMERLFRRVLSVTKAYILGILSHNYCYCPEPTTTQQSMKQTIVDLWNVYLDGVETCAKEVLLYESKLFELADRHGNLPAVFFSSTSRLLYRNLVNAKITCIYNVIDKLQELLDEEVELVVLEGRTTTFPRMLYMQQAFNEVLAGNDTKRQHATLLPLDYACEDFFTIYRESIETVTSGSVKKVLQEHKRRTDRLIRLFLKAFGHMVELTSRHAAATAATGDEKQCSPQVETAMQELEKFQQTFLPSYEAVETEEDAADQEIIGSLRHHGFPSMAKAVVSCWIEQRRVMKDEDTTREAGEPMIPFMPVQLLKMMARHPRDEFGICHGGYGMRRAACILVGLFFRWMADRCEEWRAEIAEQELLTSMEDLEQSKGSLNSSAAGKGGKHGKKKKKKVKKTTIGSNNVADHVRSHVDHVEDVPSLGEMVSSDASPRSVSTNSTLPETASELWTSDQSAGVKAEAKPNKAATEGQSSESIQTSADQTSNKGWSAVDTVIPEADAGAESRVEDDAVKPGVGDASKVPPTSSEGGESASLQNASSASIGVRGSSSGSESGKIQHERRGKSRGGETVKKDPSSSGETVRQQDTDEPSKQEQYAEATNSTFEDVDAFLTIGVYDQSGFQTAEDFLVGRFMAVMNSNGTVRER